MITGSRKANRASDRVALKKAILKHAPNCQLLIHGGAKGADTLAEEIAKELGIETKIVRPNYNKYHYKAAPLKRNSEMVNEATKVIAYYHTSKTGGTLDAAKKAAKQNKLVAEYVNGKEVKPPAQQMSLL